MKIAKFENLHCDAGWRTFSFLKVTTDDGLVGWSEYTEADGSRGLSGGDPGDGRGADRARSAAGAVDRLRCCMCDRCRRRTASTSGPSRRSRTPCSTSRAKPWACRCTSCSADRFATRIPVYWSHCGTYRVRNHELVGVPPLKNYDDVAALGAEVKRRGFKALKTNILPYENGKLVSFGPGFGRTPGHPELNCRPADVAGGARHAGGVSSRGRTRDGAAPGRELSFQDRGLPAGRQSRRAVST